jgi:DNA polymerase-3 subunit gamma/tau
MHGHHFASTLARLLTGTRTGISVACDSLLAIVADPPPSERETTYQSLYRKYRPQGPEEVVGQEHVVRALMGAMRETPPRLAHAYLFCGPRGTGKTSTARILAKMVNCEKGPTAEPCGVCEQCIRIRDGSHLDVSEIDAASHGGVDDARELRERAPTAPVMGREKVYILDEAQRLSREAFDALLKLFEEPPPNVRFVLATTEPHKMPPTIVGRCQRFDFRRIATDQLADLLGRIGEQEGFSLTRGAAEALARQAEGSARDAESLLDQCSVLGAGVITEETVAALIGDSEIDLPFELADAVAVGDARGVFDGVERLVQEGHDLRHFAGQVLNHFRDLLLVHSAPDDPTVLDASPDRHARLAVQASKFSTAELSRILALLVAASTDLRWTTSPRLTVELALVRAALPEADPTPAGLGARIERLERLAGVVGAAGGGVDGIDRPMGDGVGSAGQPPPNPGSADAITHVRKGSDAAPTAGHSAGADAVDEVVGSAAPSAIVESESAPQEVTEAVEAPVAAVATPQAHAPDAGALDVAAIRRSWPQLLGNLREKRQMVLMASLESATAAAYDGATLELAFPPGRRFAVERVTSKESELKQALVDVFGVAPRVVCAERGAPAGVAEDEVVVIEDDDEPPLDPKAALERFKAEFAAELEPDDEQRNG